MIFDPNLSPVPSKFLADTKRQLEDRDDKESSSSLIPLTPTPTSTPTPPISATSPLRVSSQSNKGQHPTRYINEAYMFLVSDPSISSYE